VVENSVAVNAVVSVVENSVVENSVAVNAVVSVVENSVEESSAVENSVEEVTVVESSEAKDGAAAAGEVKDGVVTDGEETDGEEDMEDGEDMDGMVPDGVVIGVPITVTATVTVTVQDMWILLSLQERHIQSQFQRHIQSMSRIQSMSHTQFQHTILDTDQLHTILDTDQPHTIQITDQLQELHTIQITDQLLYPGDLNSHQTLSNTAPHWTLTLLSCQVNAWLSARQPQMALGGAKRPIWPLHGKIEKTVTRKAFNQVLVYSFMSNLVYNSPRVLIGTLKVRDISRFNAIEILVITGPNYIHILIQCINMEQAMMSAFF